MKDKVLCVKSYGLPHLKCGFLFTLVRLSRCNGRASVTHHVYVPYTRGETATIVLQNIICMIVITIKKTTTCLLPARSSVIFF